MATGAQNLGRVGLAHNVDKRSSARMDLAVMGQMVQQKKELEAEEQQAALIEQKFYEQIRAEAEQMLAGDKSKINARSKNLQAQIRSQIKANGGSRSKFLANGGVAVLGDYSKNLLESKEVAQFKENKINLEQLLEIKKKGMGHLLADKDRLSLSEYNKHGTGTISYSGLKSEIEIPPADSFMFGTYATPMEMLQHGENYMKILGNYKIDNPDSEIETYDQQKQYETLLMYTREQGWTQRGSKMDPNAYRRRQSSQRTDGRKTDKDGKVMITRSGDLTAYFGIYNQNISLDEMNESHLLKDEYLKNTFGNKTYSKKGVGRMTILDGLGQTAAYASGIGGLLMTSGLWDYEENNGYIPRGAADLGRNMAVPLWKTENTSDYTIENGTIKNVKGTDLENVYFANGAPVLNKDHMKNGDYKILGAFAGYEFLAQGESYLVVDAVDKNGKMDKDRNEDLYVTREGAEEPEGKRAMFITLEDKKGNTFYQKINYSGLSQERDLAAALGDSNDLSRQFMEREQNEKSLASKKEQILIHKESKADLEVNHEIFDTNVSFQEAMASYNSYNSGGTRRSNIMKAFYMAQFDTITSNEKIAHLADLNGSVNDNDFFTQLIQGHGLELDLKDVNITDEKLMDLIEASMTSDSYNSDTPNKKETLRSNRIFVSRMRNYLRKARTITKENPPKAEDGAQFGFTPGSQWAVEKNLTGPSHAKGGFNINPNTL